MSFAGQNAAPLLACAAPLAAPSARSLQAAPVSGPSLRVRALVGSPESREQGAVTFKCGGSLQAAAASAAAAAAAVPQVQLHVPAAVLAARACPPLRHQSAAHVPHASLEVALPADLHIMLCPPLGLLLLLGRRRGGGEGGGVWKEGEPPPGLQPCLGSP